jgi:hypothetical protein
VKEFVQVIDCFNLRDVLNEFESNGGVGLTIREWQLQTIFIDQDVGSILEGLDRLNIKPLQYSCIRINEILWIDFKHIKRLVFLPRKPFEVIVMPVQLIVLRLYLDEVVASVTEE